MTISRRKFSRRKLLATGLTCGAVILTEPAVGQSSILSEGVPAERLRQLVAAMRRMGEPIPDEDTVRIFALAEQHSAGADAELERILNKYTLLRLQIDKSGIGRCTSGGAKTQLAELGWRSFFVRVDNPARFSGPLTLVSTAALPEGTVQPGIHESHILGNDRPESVLTPPDLDTDYENDASRWLGFRFGTDLPGDMGLQGLPLEYLLLQLYSQRGGTNTARIFLAAAKLQSIRLMDCRGPSVEFISIPASAVTIRVRDWDGAGAMASLLIRDEAGRLYCAPAHRVEPDLVFQPEIYRADGESIRLPSGRYQVIALRGPEYLECHQELVIPTGGAPATLSLALERWIDPARQGWYPGDPHIHPEGQAYNVVSKYGLTPETLFRQVRGEALCVGSILIWAGGYYYEKQFLTGHVVEPRYELPFPDAQRDNNQTLIPQRTAHDSETLIRYDVEQAAFPSNRLGHPVLLRLKNHEFLNGGSIYDWPSWNLPVMQWAKERGGVAGYAHCGLRMPLITETLPNFDPPAMEGLGANECLVDVTHGAVDFVAGCETHPVMELNFWYHLLNCGFRLPMVGETDFWTGKSRVGTGRTYVQLDRRPAGDSGYDSWVAGIKAGRLYFGDGRSHLIGLKINHQALGMEALNLRKPGRVVVSLSVAARLDEKPLDPDDERIVRPNSYWHLERARIGPSRRVALEIVVNSQVVERREIIADGTQQSLSFAVDIADSSWIAARILPSSHTAPAFVSVAGQPVRASRRSAQWCLECVDILWSQHSKRIRESERAAAAAAWEHARTVYRQISSECSTD